MTGERPEVSFLKFLPDFGLVVVPGNELLALEGDPELIFFYYLLFLGQKIEVAAVCSVIGTQPYPPIIFDCV